jgi:hypothetical protein
MGGGMGMAGRGVRRGKGFRGVEVKGFKVKIFKVKGFKIKFILRRKALRAFHRYMRG